jgi:hypothetical protein
MFVVQIVIWLNAVEPVKHFQNLSNICEQGRALPKKALFLSF